MSENKNMKDVQHLFEKIKKISTKILNNSRHSPTSPHLMSLGVSSSHQSSHLFCIPEESELNFEDLESYACQLSNGNNSQLLDSDFYYQVALRSNEFYERYKALYLQLSVLMEEDKDYLQALNQLIGKKTVEAQSGQVIHALVEWRKQGFKKKSPLEKSHRELILQCYLYHIILEKVYFNYFGLVDDAILKKLFSQGIVIYGITDMYFRNQRHIMEHLQHIGIPLGIEYDNCLINLNRGKKKSYTYSLRHWTLEANIYRLGFLRTRRLSICLNNAFAFKDINWWMATFDPMIQSSMSVINFLYFIPRFLSHLLMIFKHVLIHDWMTKEEKELSKWKRFQIQWQRRWEILQRDSFWLANGILNLFVFLGPYGVWSLPMNAFFQFAEMLLNWYLLRDFNAQKRTAIDFFKTHHVFNYSGMAQKLDHFLTAYEERLNLEEKNRHQRLVNSILVFISNLLVCAFFAKISLYFPLVGAIIGVLMTFVQIYTRFAWEKEKNQMTEPFDLPAIYSPKYALLPKKIKNQATNDITTSNLGLKLH